MGYKLAAHGAYSTQEVRCFFFFFFFALHSVGWFNVLVKSNYYMLNILKPGIFLSLSLSLAFLQSSEELPVLGSPDSL